MKTLLTVILFGVINLSIYAQCPSAGPDANACGQTAQLNSVGINGFWTGPIGAIYTPSNTEPNANVWIPSYTTETHLETFTWNESGCTPADQVIITFMKPPHSEAGPFQAVCGTTTQMAADTIGSGIINGWWTCNVPGITITPTGTDPIPWNPNVDVSSLGNGFWINSQRDVWFYWNSQNAASCSSTDSVLVTFYQKPDATAGIDTSVCGKTYDLDGVWSVDNHSGNWTMLAIPPAPGSSNFIPSTSPNAVVTVTDYGSYYFIWKEMNQNNTTCFDRDTVRVEFNVVPMPDAGLDFSVCGKYAYICAIPSVSGGSWSCPSGGIAYYDAENGNYSPSNYLVPCTWIRYSSENDTVTMFWFENNGVCTGYDSVDVYFSSIQPAISLTDPIDSVNCGPVCNILNAQQPAYGLGYWYDTIQNTTFLPSPNHPSPIVTIDTGGVNYSGFHSFFWVTVNGLCRDTSNVVRVRFKESPLSNAGVDLTVCGPWAQLNAIPITEGSGQWYCIQAGVNFYNTINGIISPSNNLLSSTWIKSSEVDTVKSMIWAVTFQDCYLTDTVIVRFENCGYSGPDDTTCGQSYIFHAASNYASGSSFHWDCLTAPVIFSNDTLLNPEVILPNYSSLSTVYTFVLTESNPSNSFLASDTVNITFFEGCNEIKGLVFYDMNFNGIYDNGDHFAVNIIVKIDNDYVSTDIFGEYNYIASSGNHFISIPTIPNSVQLSPSSHSAVFIGSGATDSLNNFVLTMSTDTNLSIYSAISAARPGFSCTHYIAGFNYGQFTINANLKLILDSRVIYNGASITPDIVNGNILEWINIPIIANNYKNISINTTIPSTLALGTLLKDSAYVFPIVGDIQPANNEYISQTVVTGSFDPNEKTVSPENGLTPAQLAAGDFLNYTIHFQNTGNDTAFTIILKDTLSSLLDVGTLQILGSSHNVNMQILGHGTVIWTFPNILLPDSNVNEPLSKGFISYKIKPLSTLIISDQIDNTAYIYFDYNLPVVTNTTTSYIRNPDAVFDESIFENNLTVFPNPFTDNCSVKFYLKESSPVLIEIYDITGNKIATLCNEDKQQGSHNINYSFQNTNDQQFYLIRMVSNEGQFVKKAIKL